MRHPAQQSIFANVCLYEVASWSSAALSFVLASLSDVDVPRSDAMLFTEDSNALFASSTAFLRLSLRSPRAFLILVRSSPIVCRLLVILSVVAVEIVRPLSVSTCLEMSSRAEQTVFLASSSLEESPPQAARPHAATAAIRRIARRLMARRPPPAWRD